MTTKKVKHKDDAGRVSTVRGKMRRETVTADEYISLRRKMSKMSKKCIEIKKKEKKKK